MPSEGLHLLLQVAQVKQLRRGNIIYINNLQELKFNYLEQMISAGSNEPVAVLIPGAVHDCRFVRMDCREDLGKTE